MLAFPGSKNSELYRVTVQCQNQKGKWVWFSWVGTELKVQVLLLCFFFSLIIECFASVSGCKSLLEKFFHLFLERRNQTILPQELGRYSPKFSISNLFYTMHNFFYILLEKSDLIKLNLENNFGPFGGLFIYLFIYWEDYNKQTNKRFRFSQEVFAWKDVLKALFEISLVQSFCLTGKP